jgi:glucose-6-phosphate isomerase
MKKYISDLNGKASDDIIYSVYRNVSRQSDATEIQSAHIRYDITIIPPGVFTGERSEFVRTAGHYHPVKPGSSTRFAEVYEVILGRAYWILQRPNFANPSEIEEIYIVEAGPGEKLVMIPGFGHMLVNAFRETLITANWINDTFIYDYHPYEQLRGSGYWMIESLTPDTIEFMRNTNYTKIPELQKLRPRDIPEFGLNQREPLYHLVRSLEKLDFLSNPERYAELLTVAHCFQTL